MIKFVFEMLNMIFIGFVTGAFTGGLILGQGIAGAVIGGVTGAALLVILMILFHFMKWNQAKIKMKYASIGILPGALIGGSQLLGFSAKGAIIFGICNAMIYSTLIDKMIQSHEKNERYVLYNGHYFILFLLGSIGTFVTINVIGIIDNFVDFESLVEKLPFYETSLIVVGVILGIYFIKLFTKKRKLETWSQAVKASKKLLSTLSGIVAVLLVATSLTRLGMIPLNSLLRGVVGIVFPYFVGLFLPLSFGYLLAANKNRPVLGSVFSLLGGSLVLLVGISVAPMLLLPGSGLMWAGLIIGLFMVMLSIFSMVNPNSHLLLGCSIIIFSILSFIGASGGLVVGGVLGILGGTFIAAWDGKQSKKINDDHPISKSSKGISSAQSNTVTG